MVISKQLGVFLNYVPNRFNLTVNGALEDAGFDITAEQFLLLDTLWTEGPLAQQRIADFMLKDKNSVYLYRVIAAIPGRQAGYSWIRPMRICNSATCRLPACVSSCRWMTLSVKLYA